MDVAVGGGQGRTKPAKDGRECLWCGVRIALDMPARHIALALSYWYTRTAAGSVPIPSQKGAEVAGCDVCREDTEEAIAQMADAFVYDGHMERLTARQLEILSLSCQGMRPREIAVELVIAEGTARTHIKEIYRRLGVHGMMEAAAVARRRGLVIENEHVLVKVHR